MTDRTPPSADSTAAREPSGTPARGSSRAAKSARRKRRRVILAVASVLLIVAAAAGGWLAYRALQIRDNLESSMALLPQLEAAVSDRDPELAGSVTADLQDRTTAARTAGTDPVWKAAGLLPFLGQNFDAVSEVTVSADDVVSRAVAPLVDEVAALDWESLTPVDGRIDTAPLSDLAPTLSAAANTVELSYGRLEGIDRSRLLPQIAGPLEDAVNTLDEARGPINSASRAGELLPPMLGADGPRTYLVLIQNSAEIRATGGIPGAFAVIRTDGGGIELVGQGSAADLGQFTPPLDVDGQQVQIYSSRLGGFLQSANLTPDFPTAAETSKRMYETRNPGTTIDGVLALDPVVLANILQATGPMELDDFEDPTTDGLIAQAGLPTSLTADNVVQTLLSDTYARIEEPSLQDDYFAAVGARIFSALADGQGESTALVDALTRSSEDNRLFVWSNISAEQDVIGDTRLGGAVSGASKGGAAFDVYFNDGTGAKMDYYVTRTVEVLQPCQQDGYRDYTVRVTLTNTAPADAAESLPAYVTGAGAFGIPPGEVRTNVVGYGPAQADLGTASVDGADVPVGSFIHDNRPVGVVTAQLAPGETVTVDFRFTGVTQTGEPALTVTPTVQPVSDVIRESTTAADCR